MYESRKLLGKTTTKLMYRAYKAVNKIVGQTKWQVEEFKKNRKIENIELLRYIITPFHLTENYTKNRKKIFWISRCEKWKRPELFIQLAKKYPTLNFEMVCTQTKDIDYWNQIQKEANQYSNILFYNYLTNNEVIRLMESSAFFVITSYQEGYPNTLLEAMISGCPILSNSINPDNIFEDYQIGYFTNNNETQFFNKFQELIESFQMRKEFAKNSFNYVKINHGAKENVEVLKKHITAVLNK